MAYAVLNSISREGVVSPAQWHAVQLGKVLKEAAAKMTFVLLPSAFILRVNEEAPRPSVLQVRLETLMHDKEFVLC